jgi:6-pyruvoyltetrahydropterin/6-carboxytetrahydropterin synthase
MGAFRLANSTIKKVKVFSDSLIFSSAHFLFSKDKCEHIHGHNFKIKFEIEGTENAQGMVFDILTLRSIGEEICRELDHKLLIPKRSEYIKLKNNSNQIDIYLASDKHYSFPKDDVLLLPLKSITLEELIEYIFKKYIKKYRFEKNVERISITMEELPGQEVTMIKDLM